MPVLHTLLERYLTECRLVNRAEILVKELVVARYAYHCSIVGSIAELRNIDSPAITLGIIVERITQSVVGRNTTCHSHMLYACLLHGKAQFLHQYVNDSVFKTRCKVVLVMLNKVRIVLNPLTQTIQERSLQSAETIVQTRNVRFSKLIGERIALTC